MTSFLCKDLYMLYCLIFEQIFKYVIIMNKICKHMPEKDVLDIIPEDDILSYIADFFDALGDFTRLKIIWALTNREFTTCELSKILNISVSAISHQLRLLKDRRIVKSRKDGRNVYYSIADKHVSSILKTTLRHVLEKGSRVI